jgi:hypothetical protein
MTGWSHRVRRPVGPQELQQLRDAAQDIAQQSGHAPGRVRVVFQTVADCAFIGTAVISGALASIHLWKALFPRPHEEHRDHSAETSGNGREPPRRLQSVASGDEPDRAQSR